MKKTIIVIVILIIALIVWYAYDLKNEPLDEGLNPNTITIDEDTTTSIEEDLESLDLGDLESELDSLDQELENL